MKLEHFALNVSNPREMAKWYVENLNFKIASSMNKEPFTHFLSDKNGGMIEIYHNATGEILDFHNTHPLTVHLAFVSEDPDQDRLRLEKEGAFFVEEVKLQDGGHLVMMKDPWGVAIQFCKRGTPWK